MKQRALITGGAGFIGSHLAERLVREGWDVRILDNLSSGSWANVAHLNGSVECLEGDIRSRGTCLAACEGVDVVFHLAAVASVALSVSDPDFSHDVNVNGTVRMLSAAREQGVRRFVFASSAAVYGNAERVPTDESQPLQPQSPYATGKATGELYCRNYADLFGLETVALRFFNVFGPRQPSAGYAAAIPCFINAVVSGRRPVIFGDGCQTRDFIYVEDVVDANLRAATATGASGRVFNVAGGEGISLLRLLRELERLTGNPVEPEFRPSRPGEVRHSRADVSVARRILGFEPVIGFSAGIERTLRSAGTPVSSGRVAPVLVSAAA